MLIRSLRTILKHNGINTIAITLWIDPRLAKLGKYKNHILRVYSDLLIVRVISSVLSYLILGLILLLFLL